MAGKRLETWARAIHESLNALLRNILHPDSGMLSPRGRVGKIYRVVYRFYMYELMMRHEVRGRLARDFRGRLDGNW